MTPSWVAEGGDRADVALARLADVPRAVAREALRSGAVKLGGKPVRPGQRLAAGDTLEGEVREAAEEVPVAEPIPLEVRYSDDLVLVVSKPAGLVTHPAGRHRSGTLVNALLALSPNLGGPDRTRPGIVHRLDKDTSGLVLVARDDLTHKFLSRALKERRVTREYVALVRGLLEEERGTVDAPVGRHPRDRRKMAVVADGRAAVTHYEVLARKDRVTLLRVTLETGRTHQIRVHLAHLSHPVLGDGTYGGRSELSRDLGLRRPFLHARRLVFPHPERGMVEVEDPLPGALRGVLVRLGLDPDLHT